MRTADCLFRNPVTAGGRLTTSVAECPGGVTVELITIDGGGHEWPATATDTIWRFFAAHDHQRARD
jgi:polyhydroxybutyrate depolymerase